eukprot:scaffold69821_cov30-Phaeocystis_antarctica.AAC.1
MEDGKPGAGGGDNRPTSHDCAFDAVLGPDCSGRQVLTLTRTRTLTLLVAAGTNLNPNRH